MLRKLENYRIRFARLFLNYKKIALRINILGAIILNIVNCFFFLLCIELVKEIVQILHEFQFFAVIMQIFFYNGPTCLAFHTRHDSYDFIGEFDSFSEFTLTRQFAIRSAVDSFINHQILINSKASLGWVFSAFNRLVSFKFFIFCPPYWPYCFPAGNSKKCFARREHYIVWKELLNNYAMIL